MLLDCLNVVIVIFPTAVKFKGERVPNAMISYKSSRMAITLASMKTIVREDLLNWTMNEICLGIFF